MENKISIVVVIASIVFTVALFVGELGGAA